MPLFTERNNLRKPKEKTYEISPDAYNFLFKVCEKYFINLAWEFPSYCPDDGASICSYDRLSLIEELKFEIPLLLYNGDFIKASSAPHPFDGGTIENYDPFSILDFIEFIFSEMKDYEFEWYHSFFRHDHIRFLETKTISIVFVNDINKAFGRTGLLYELKENGEIERIVSNSESIKELEGKIKECSDDSLKEIVDEAIHFYLKPGSNNTGIAVEKIWDAFERAKTCYKELDKKESAKELINAISCGQKEYGEVLDKEFHELTNIGNKFRIRHHETDKIDFVSNEQREYFFNRCMSLLLLIAEYIK